jgi:hypothetical protein
MSAPVADDTSSPPPAQPGVAPEKTSEVAPPHAEEVDVWWGSYSPWTMLPSFLVCVSLTALIAWAAWHSLDRIFVQLTILGAAGLVWLVQSYRLCRRVFGINYRLTTRRLFRDEGLVQPLSLALQLSAVARVQIRRNGYERLVGIGHLLVLCEDRAALPLLLEGVAAPQEVAELIRATALKARAEMPAPT